MFACVYVRVAARARMCLRARSRGNENVINNGAIVLCRALLPASRVNNAGDDTAESGGPESDSVVDSVRAVVITSLWAVRRMPRLINSCRLSSEGPFHLFFFFFLAALGAAYSFLIRSAPIVNANVRTHVVCRF